MTENLPAVLETSDMLEIDGLHAFDFELDNEKLLITAMDGRAEKRWRFSLEQVNAATFDDTLQSWTLTGDSGEHRLICMSAFTGNNNDEDEADDDA
ncbi:MULTISPECIES: DUF5629 family protein [Pseudomonas]|jgi:hypothetical protein|uniref:DUF5629 family protein n=1 Tax=Pseudomonas TaxID=286 RepID=UPI0008ACAD0E|nr:MULTISPECIES: DUF5629 family protein [Pseudomonas]PMV21205.1 hypothetical protein C1X17_17885 [Pseudomonas sp. FW305-3-2-15-C-TSA2]PMV25727.1 hypothetical protein C1X22_19600 [Pseudomonas sp. DP16D-L5]PMV37970.1 hypothetical protein C1X21_17225 [Pseudomonas sp. FW305-3-2-15-A-LB2]PMV44373.1 hypothetical protein C1X16_17535 [Pseudomonas sp. FW305-3-2-15-C-R2A1]PMV45147.1 hypothetical protein C1X18_25240 [Pseudomonas sp. FW305-3-2-15-C-LB1]